MPASSSLYRKYRSQNFDELVGQEPVVRTLKNAIASGRIAHAYLFTGPRGVGKTSAARLLARAANCTSTDKEKPCNECPNCLAATRDIATDLIEIDAASNTGVDNIREVIERANFAPSIWNTKFYIIDEVHMLSASAFNALLKTLEEPPPHTSFVLATTEVHKVPATVASRCQRFDFRRIPLSAMLGRLKYICEQEGIQAEESALELVARQATGSLRDAESLLDQLRVYSEGEVTLQNVREMLGAGGEEEVSDFVDALLARDLPNGLRRINAALEEGLDLRQFNRQLVEHLRGMLLLKSGVAGDNGLLDVTAEMRARMSSQGSQVSIPDLLRWMHVFSEADASLRTSVYGQLPLELAFVTAALPEEPSAAQPAIDHRQEISAGIEQVAVPPRQRPRSPEVPRRDAPPSSVPPPIHTELEAIAETARILPIENGVPLPEPDFAEVSANDESATVANHTDRDAEEELTRLIESWPAVVDQINARSKPMAGIYGNPALVKPVKVVGGLCTISFRDAIAAKRSADNFHNAPNRDIVESALSRVMGYPCRVECITFAQAEAGAWGRDVPPPGKANGRSATREKPSPYETSRGKAAMNIFGIDKFEEN